MAMLVPAPRPHEITYFALLAANAKRRSDKRCIAPICRKATRSKIEQGVVLFLCCSYCSTNFSFPSRNAVSKRCWR